jgi:hypothetical protein
MLSSQYCRKKQWDIVDRAKFTEHLTLVEPERQEVEEEARAFTQGDSDRAAKFADQILYRILQPTGDAPSRGRVGVIIWQLISAFVGQPTTWRLTAEVNGVWPESASVRLTPAAVIRQVWSVKYRDDVDAVETWFDLTWEHIPDAEIDMARQAVTSAALERQLRALVRVLTLLGPNRVRLLRYARSELGKTGLVSAMAAASRHSDSGGWYCIKKSKAAHCRTFIQHILPLLDGSSRDPPDGSMQKIGASTMDLYDEGLRNHPDTVGGIAFKIVSLESMFLGDEETAEISYKLRNRVAAALAILAGIDGSQVVGDLKKAYDIRSGFFHGHVESKDRKAATLELANRLGDYCRATISVFLQSGSIDRKVFLRDLDAGMVDPKLRTVLQQKLQLRRFSFPLTAAECGQPH